MNKLLYNNYIRNAESDIKSNPKRFWNFVKARKACSNIPSAVFLEDKFACTPREAANLFAEFLNQILFAMILTLIRIFQPIYLHCLILAPCVFPQRMSLRGSLHLNPLHIRILMAFRLSY